MTTLSQPVSPPANYAAQLEIIRKIECLGGSTGYDLNPNAFRELVTFLDPFRPDVWAGSIKELAKYHNDRAAQALKTELQTELDLHHSNRRLAEKQRVFKIIQGIESLGGSLGLETFAKGSRTSKRTATDTRASVDTAAWPAVYAWGFAAGGVVITSVTIHVGEDHHGTGYAWGPAFGAGNLQGTLAYESYRANGFHFQNLDGVAAAEIMLDGKLTSQFVGVLLGHNASLAFGGKWQW